VLILPIGVLIVFLVASSDIIHSFGILSLGIKIDAISGRINLVYELVKLNGKIKGFCYELCGQYHSNMVILGLVFVLKNCLIYLLTLFILMICFFVFNNVFICS
jgi:heme/copper-type cytochrome/quinol oxidase subunit 2